MLNSSLVVFTVLDVGVDSSSQSLILYSSSWRSGRGDDTHDKPFYCPDFFLVTG